MNTVAFEEFKTMNAEALTAVSGGFFPFPPTPPYPVYPIWAGSGAMIGSVVGALGAELY